MNYNNIKDDLKRITESEFIVKYSLCDKATKILLKLFVLSEKDREKFWTFSDVRKSFRSITTDEVHAVLGEFENLGLVETQQKNLKFVVRLNLTGQQTNNFDRSRHQNIQEYVKQREKRKATRALQTLKDFDKETVKEVFEEIFKDSPVSQQTNLESYNLNTKTALELHTANPKECDEANCRFCLFEKKEKEGLQL